MTPPTFLLLCACAADFSGGSLELGGAPRNRVGLELSVNGVAVEPGEGLLELYGNSLPEGFNSCATTTIRITGEALTERKSAWYLGMALMVPFWPAMPSKTTLNYTLEASVACEGAPRQHVVLTETEEREMFFYGAIRTAEITEASNWLHVKFAARLTEALTVNKPADTSTRSDF